MYVMLTHFPNFISLNIANVVDYLVMTKDLSVILANKLHFLWKEREIRLNNANKKASDIFLYRRLQLKRRLPTLPQTQYHRRDKA